MSIRRMVFSGVLVLAAALAAPAAAAEPDPAQLALFDIFADPAIELPAGDTAQARSTCVEGEKFWFFTLVCCSATRQFQEEQKCTGGVWVPTGRTRCFPPSCFA